MYLQFLGTLFAIKAFACSICSVMERVGLDANSPDPPAEQNIQPLVSIFPSRLGQVIPPFSESLYVLTPKRALKYSFPVLIFTIRLLSTKLDVDCNTKIKFRLSFLDFLLYNMCIDDLIQPFLTGFILVSDVQGSIPNVSINNK